MIKRTLLTMLSLIAIGASALAQREINPQPIVDLCNRVCGDATAEQFTFIVEPEIDGCARQFTIEPADGKIQVTASDRTSLCCGLNWYLNHTSHINIAWNSLRARPTAATQYPLPTQRETHSTYATYSYYLNYCTFSYSMAVWDEERWMQEIDWMALHGVNLPLQAVGIDAVWYRMLTAEFGFTHDEASSFIAGPAFQGWWLMNNLTGHGGPNPQWWYERQADLGRKITDRMRELGMSPCLPGFVGMAPQKYITQTDATAYSGSWCGFTSPLLMSSGRAFDRMAEQYYKYIEDVYGFLPSSYSMDPVHERGLPNGMGQVGYKDLCDAARAAMNTWGKAADATTDPLWVAQEWQVNADQHRINALSNENTLLLDLSSERLTYKARYGSKQYLFCMLHNYGGNVGMYGCVRKMLQEYEGHLQTGHANRLSTGVTTSSSGFICGVGATPEGIETNPMLYDLLFELPWYADVPDATDWLREYVTNRYGIVSEEAQRAWLNLLETVYDNTNSNQQGCREPVFCARPNLTGADASSWAHASYTWDKQKIVDAARLLLSLSESASQRGSYQQANYQYDLVDFTRQALTDYAHTLQMQMASVVGAQGYQSDEFKALSDQFLALMDDIDCLLGTVEDFRLGRWTEMARRVAIDAGHPEDADWMERGARMLITTWGDTEAATNNGGLRDYGNREWQGLITSYYKPRWIAYFEQLQRKGSCTITAKGWLDSYERPFVYGTKVAYGTYTQAADHADKPALCRELLDKYCPVREPSKWEEPAISSQGLGETQGYHCYIKQFQYTVGGVTQTIYTRNSDPTTLFEVVETPISAHAGDEVTITWQGNNDYLNYCYLSAYLDSNSDGTFDILLYTLGTQAKYDNRVRDGSFTFTVPQDLDQPTRLRLRYDGAWNTGWDAATQAFPALNLANRPVYDIQLQILAPDAITQHLSADRQAQYSTYDLQGRRTNTDAHGIVIQNGIKFLSF